VPLFIHVPLAFTAPCRVFC